MKKAFLIYPDDNAFQQTNSYIINAVPKFYVPGIKCAACNATWSMTGIHYPTIDIGLLEFMKKDLKPIPVAFNRFKEISENLRRIIGVGRPIFPGTQLGPFYGTGKGKMGDFIWINPWTPILRESLLLEFKKRDINIAVAETKIRLLSKTSSRYFEIEAVPRLVISKLASELSIDCFVCGRITMKEMSAPIIMHDSFDSNIPIQRCIELPTAIVVNEAFAMAITELKSSNVLLREVAVR